MSACDYNIRSGRLKYLKIYYYILYVRTVAELERCTRLVLLRSTKSKWASITIRRGCSWIFNIVFFFLLLVENVIIVPRVRRVFRWTALATLLAVMRVLHTCSEVVLYILQSYHPLPQAKLTSHSGLKFFLFRFSSQL